MAELKVKIDNGIIQKSNQDKNGNDIVDTYFPKSGGELSNAFLKRNVDNSFLVVMGGSGPDAGGYMQAFGKDYGNIKGGVLLVAQNDTERAKLELNTDGSLKVDDNDLTGSAIVAKSLGKNGYVKYASGLIIQWGYANAGRESLVTLPIEFSNNKYSVVSTSDTSDHTDGGNVVITNLTNNNFTIYKNAGAIGGRWIAIGY